MSNGEKTAGKSLFSYEGNAPIAKVIPISLQHVMAMFVGTVTVPMVVANACGVTEEEKQLLIQFALLMAGLGTLLQLYPIKGLGARVPIVFSVGFTFVPTLTVIGSQYGLSGVFGAQIIAGVVTLIMGFGIKYIRRFFPPFVTGTIILSIGLSLYPIAIKYMAGGEGSDGYGSLKNWMVAGITLATVIFCNMFCKGYVQLAGIVIGVIVGYVVSLFLGMVDFSGIAGAGLITVPIPFQFGISFSPTAVIAIILLTIVNVMQTVGDITGTTVGGFDREPTSEELSGGILGSGIITIIGACFGGLPVSTYSQNVGIVSMTKVVNRRVIGGAAVLMLILGLFPKFSAVVATMPKAVIGGATVVVFGMITITGVRLLKDDLSHRNATIAGLALALGMGASMVPAAVSGFPEAMHTFLTEPILVSGLSAFLLNLIVPNKTEDDEQAEMEALED